MTEEDQRGKIQQMLDDARAKHPEITFTDIERYMPQPFDYVQAKQIVQKIIKLDIEKQPLLDELQRRGLNITSGDELAQASHQEYPTLIPILIEELAGDYTPPIRSYMAMIAGDKEGRKHIAEIQDAYRRETDDKVRRQLGATLYLHLTAKDLNFIEEVLSDEKYGESRKLIMGKLEELRTPKKYTIAEKYVDDPLLGTIAQRMLSRKK